jgi:hypothetical protein
MFGLNQKDEVSYCHEMILFIYLFIIFFYVSLFFFWVLTNGFYHFWL